METTVYAILVELTGTPVNDVQQTILYLLSTTLSVFLILMLFYILFILAKIAR